MFVAPSLSKDIAPRVPKAKRHIVNHLVCGAFLCDARFQDALVSNSDTKARRQIGLLIMKLRRGGGAEGARAASRQKSGRWKKAGSSERRRARRSGEAARRVTWPNLRPGRGDLP